jgi:hypothetical protein
MDGSYKDSQARYHHSLWLTDTEAIVPMKQIDRQTRSAPELLYPKLLNPPLRFCLALLHDGHPQNDLHLMVVNDVSIINANTTLQFTANNIAMVYSPYELEKALRDDNNSRSPGVAALLAAIGPYKLPEKPVLDRKAGRPKEDDREDVIAAREARRVIRASGMVDVAKVA